MARFEDQRASAQPTKRVQRSSGSSSVASAVTGLVRDGIDAMRSRPETLPAAPAQPQGLLSRVFNALAAPLATAAVSVVPSVIRETREAERERAERRAAAAQMTLTHVENMAKTRAKPPAKTPAVPSWEGTGMPAPASAEVQVCDDKGLFCTSIYLRKGKGGRIVARTKDGKRAHCDVDRDGQLTCAIGRRTLTGPVKH